MSYTVGYYTSLPTSSDNPIAKATVKSNGDFNFDTPLPLNGYVWIPPTSSYSFSPKQVTSGNYRNVVLNGASSNISYTISGIVQDQNGNGLDGYTMQVNGNYVATTQSKTVSKSTQKGTYSFTLSATQMSNAILTVVPPSDVTNYAVSPGQVQLQIPSDGSTTITQNFTVTISSPGSTEYYINGGTVYSNGTPASGVQITYPNAGITRYSSSAGLYNFSLLGSQLGGVVTASLSGYTTSPSSITLNTSYSSQIVQLSNFVLTSTNTTPSVTPSPTNPIISGSPSSHTLMWVAIGTAAAAIGIILVIYLFKKKR